MGNVRKHNSMFFSLGWKKLFDLYYHIEISEQFIRCADIQLQNLFTKETGLNHYGITHLIWEPNEELIYTQGEISSLKSTLTFQYGRQPVTIYWKSTSGHLYNLFDTAIECTDIEFWFGGLHPEQCHHLSDPRWSLFTFPETYIEQFQKRYGKTISYQFIQCADTQLSKAFELHTGIKLNKDISITWVPEEKFILEIGKDSKLSSEIYINNNWNPVIIHWKSKSGHIYTIADQEIDCSDIEFWFEGLDPLLYNKQLKNEKV